MNEADKGFWSWVAKASALVVLAGGIVALVKYVGEPRHSLHAVVKVASYELPPKLDVLGRELENAVSPLAMSEALAEIANKNDETSMSRGERAIYISNKLRQILAPDEVREQADLKTFWSASVANDGDLPVDGVVLRISDVKLARVTREDDSAVLDKAGPRIEIGRLGARESVSVSAWSANGYYSFTDEPTLHHDNGGGDVAVVSELTWSNVLRERSGDLLYLVAIIPLVFGILSGFMAYSSYKAAQRVSLAIKLESARAEKTRMSKAKLGAEDDI